MKKAEKAYVSGGIHFLRVLRAVLVYLLAAVIVIGAILFAMDKSPQKSLFGYRYYTVLTASMKPELSIGDLVIVKRTDADNIEVGDVITFNPSSDSDAYLTHRVTEKLMDYEGSDVICFRTKGDANDTEDSFLIDEERVIGVVKFEIPWLGYLIRFVQLRWYFVIPLMIMLIILLKLVKIYINGFSGDKSTAMQDAHGDVEESAGSAEKMERKARAPN